MDDLVILVADKNMRFALEALLARHESLEIRPIEALVLTHPRRDPAVLRESHDFLRSRQGLASYALVVFDREGCGDVQPREVLEESVELKLAQNGWAGRSAAVVVDPELEVWFWSDSPQVETALRWSKGRTQLREWLVEKGFCYEGQQKPHRPKEAVESVLRLSRTPRSSSIYQDLAEHVAFQHCIDPSFLKVRSVLKRWFPP